MSYICTVGYYLAIERDGLVVCVMAWMNLRIIILRFEMMYIQAGCVQLDMYSWMCTSRLDEAQAGIKISGRNINNLGYADDTTLMVERKEELKSLLMKVKEESEKIGLKLNNQKIKIVASGPITSWQIDGETMETVTDFTLGGLQNHCKW